MIDVENLTKRYGPTTAVDGLSFQVRPGQVTGFLGPNGAGKSTTMRMIIGLDRPTAGRATVLGKPYADHPAPLGVLGALLEAGSAHRGRSARNHLRALAQTHGIGGRRVDEVLETVGLGGVARRRVGGFSLGMGQRLGFAAALLGDPAVVMLDEPVNGLDPDGCPVDPHPAAGPGRRRAHGARVEPPDERDGRHRRAPGDHRQGKAAGRHHRRRQERAGARPHDFRS